MDYLISRFESAAEMLPHHLRVAAQGVSDATKRAAEELRLRVGRPLCVATPDGEISLFATASAGDAAEVVTAAARGSLHAVSQSLRECYVTAPGGHRVGVSGSAVVQSGSMTGLRTFSSVSVRVAKELPGIAQGIYEKLLAMGLPSTLILAPPGGGKTTLLRDLIRITSDSGIRVAVADERSEIAALSYGLAGFDVGAHTDVLENAPKEEAMLALLRAMNPRVLAVDEITNPRDVAAVEHVEGCGVTIFATMHAGTPAEAARRIGGVSGLFGACVVVKRGANGERQYELSAFETDGAA